MKELFIFFALAISIPSRSQDIEGVDEPHRVSAAQSGKAVEINPIIRSIELETGVSLEYAEQGEITGIPVIFLHGMIDSWRSFGQILPHLPSSFHVFALSQRGHGNSGKPVNGYTPKDFAGDVSAFMKQRGIARAVIVGHSMGGVNAMQFAIDYPSMVESVVIIDADPSFKNNPGLSGFNTIVQAMKEPMSREFMTSFQTSTVANPVDSIFMEQMIDQGMKVTVRIFQSVFNGFITVDLLQDIKRIKAPVCIFWGDRDSICLRNSQDNMLNNMPDARLIVYRNTGHALHWEHPARFAKDLISFIRSKQDIGVLACD